MAHSSKPALKKQRTFNRYDALLAEVHRLQLSKLKLLQTASAEMQKLRTFIRFLCQIDQQKQLSPEILKEINKFEATQNESRSKAHLDDNDELLSTTIQLYNTEYLSNFSNFMELQEEIQRLRDAKFQLIHTTNTEINEMRDTIKLLMNRIITRLNPHATAVSANKTTSTVNTPQNEQQTNKHSVSIPNHVHVHTDKLLHDYQQLGQDKDVVNVMLIGTQCSGKTALLRNIIFVYGGTNALFRNIKNAHYIIINSIVESIYAVLSEHEFFHSDKYKAQLRLSESMKTAIGYFEQNRLSKYNGPFLTKAVSKHIETMFAVQDTTTTQDEDEKQSELNDNDDYFVRLVFRNHAYYRNMYYFYQNIDKYTKSNWYHDGQQVSQQELLLVWDRNTSPIYYYDMVLDASQSGIVYRFWDISSIVLYEANRKYGNNLKALFEHIKASCVLYLTSPIFNYQIERDRDGNYNHSTNAMEQTAMRRSMDYFQAMFEKQDEAEKIMMEELKEEELLGFNDDVLKLARSKWELTPIIALLNKCDIFQMDMESLWDESKTILLTFPEYDGEQSYDAIINYLKVMFKSFKMSHKRPYHIHEMIAIDDTKIQKIVNHIKTVTNLYTANKRLVHQINAARAFNV